MVPNVLGLPQREAVVDDDTGLGSLLLEKELPVVGVLELTPLTVPSEEAFEPGDGDWGEPSKYDCSISVEEMASLDRFGTLPYRTAITRLLFSNSKYENILLNFFSSSNDK